MSICLRRNNYNSHLRRCLVYRGSFIAKYSQVSDESLSFNRKFVAVQGKVNDVLKWYEHFTGIDEVRSAQNKVIEAQDRFAAAQEKRREVTLELNEIKNNVKDIQEELSTIPRGEASYITLITKEHKLLKEEIRLTNKFNLYEREERELFTTLTSSVKDSHEKERIQANKTKYFSIIGSVVGALIGVIGSTVNNRSKMTELRRLVTQSGEENKHELSNVCTELEKISRSISSSVNISTKSVDPNLKEVKVSLSRMENKVNSLLRKIEHKGDNEKPSESNVDEYYSYLAPIKNNITFQLIGCVSVFMLYKLFFS